MQIKDLKRLLGNSEYKLQWTVFPQVWMQFLEGLVKPSSVKFNCENAVLNSQFPL